MLSNEEIQFCSEMVRHKARLLALNGDINPGQVRAELDMEMRYASRNNSLPEFMKALDNDGVEPCVARGWQCNDDECASCRGTGVRL